VHRILSFEPTNVGALYLAGVLFFERHRYREAIARWNEVVELEPDGEYARRARRDAKTAADLMRIFRSRGED
jgi:cytochrome c-type biogenesis protein CcmH/NrfG